MIYIYIYKGVKYSISETLVFTVFFYLIFYVTMGYYTNDGD